MARKSIIVGEDHRDDLSDRSILQVRILPKTWVKCISGIGYVGSYLTDLAYAIGTYNLFRGLMLL